ncbi:MAG TPA: type I DNA topoisomerase [Candidatus Saccharimonadales bacterium]|nr:type I DNA topoisomerase [Candidatus Saccharimonadales bacterium]
MKNLVIVESPTKARTIGRFLGKDYEIIASMGHIMDLPKSTLSVDVEHDFAPQYEMVADKKKIIAELKSAAKTADTIILATDPDREGEAIAAHIEEVLRASLKTKNEKFSRMVFHEITKEAIEEALTHPRRIDENLVDAQTARRVLDRLVGYKLSPLLWQKVRRGLSAGRVQSVALRLIVEREREIEKFKKEPYFTITAVLQNAAKKDAPFELIEIGGEKIELSEKFDLYDGQYTVTKTSITTEDKAKNIVADLQKCGFTVADVTQKEMRRSPQAPYTTSTLQQDAARRLGLAGRRTMSLAQKLYEEGHITYHRTDSTAIAKSAQFAMIDYVKKQFGEKYVPQIPRFYATKQKLAQEAHEAIRPTKVAVSAAAVSQDLGEQYGRLYELIWKRAVASQMSDAITESTSVLVDGKTSDKAYTLKANGSVLLFDGFLKVNPLGLSDNVLPEFVKGEELSQKEVSSLFHETTPPPRYNDASLIKTLEEKGIGRPSTYAGIVGTIESRGYISREENRFAPSAVGIAVNDFLVANFSDIDDIPFTAEMEDQLDAIANAQKKWVPVIADFYGPFEKKLAVVKKADRVKIAVETLDEKCPQCGNPLVIRTGRFGKFVSCSTFPDCKFTKPLVQETNFTCPKDGGKVIIKKTRKGRIFYGCSNYPKCDFAAWKLEDIKNYGDPTFQKKKRFTKKTAKKSSA